MQRSLRYPAAVVCSLLPLASAHASKFDLAGPPGSVAFGTHVLVLSNGNFVVADPAAENGAAANAGAVSLYDFSGNLISTLRGRQAGDRIGYEGIVEVGNGNFVVVSSLWIGDPGELGGAVTWVDGATGLSDVVSSSNSITGAQADSQFGSPQVTVLANGNYVVATPGWNSKLGAATWGNGAARTAGAISAGNSLVGTAQHPHVAYRGLTVAAPDPHRGVLALADGNYVVTSWNMATWGDGSVGLVGELSENNSLIGTSSDAEVYPLSNGNYVVTYLNWNGVGAAVWGSGSMGVAGPVSSNNALTGSSPSDGVGAGVVPLSNGNYVVASPLWNSYRGAVTWGNGATGVTGIVSASNSLVGSNANDQVGAVVTPLCNGNYVVGSLEWKGGTGAATWRDGSASSPGTVSTANSLVGLTAGFRTGVVITPLANCNYVVASEWPDYRGSVTWANGSSGLVGTVTTKNSLVGSAANDGTRVVAPLSNGNYVVASNWQGGIGAVTWADGTKAQAAFVSSANSLVGSVAGDQVGYYVAALPSGNYIVGSPLWNANTGAATWCNGATGTKGVVSGSNSLVGLAPNDELAEGGIFALADNNFAIDSRLWNADRGAVTLGNGSYRQAGVVPAPVTAEAANVSTANGGMPFAYDARHHQLIVGRFADNLVTIITMDDVFKDGYED